VLAFFGIEPGMRVADLMAGSGYYTELLARVVGSEGVVYAQLNRYVLDKLGDDALTARLTKPGLENVVRWNRELDALELPEAELDAVLLILFYHDTYWQKTNRAKMNADILKALKPGGLYGVIDHRAAAHAKARDVKTLHRGDAEQIRNEILAIGFVADGGRAGAGDSRGTGGSASGARTPPATG
jgi:predicted methyltransferase